MAKQIDARARATSWLLASEILRRTDTLLLRETHPGGGQYDCLTLYDGAEAVVQINRVGSIHVRGEQLADLDRWPTLDWPSGVKDAARKILKRAGLPAPERANRTTRASLTYRVMAELVSADATRLDARAALNDSSGPEGSHIDDAVMNLEPLREASPADVWALRRDDDLIARLWNGWAYTARGEHLDLYWRYRRGESVRRLAEEITA